MVPTRWVYVYGPDRVDGRGDMKELLGGKGAGLHEMARLGIPVPPGLTITTEACVYFFRNGSFPEGLKEQVREGMALLERWTGKKFGDRVHPLLVSVRSGARVSMPGMMDTILNLGLNDESVQGLAAQTGNPRFAYDSYRRLIEMYADVVLGVDRHLFEERLEAKKQEAGVRSDAELSAEHLRALVEEYKALVEKHADQAFPQDPWTQLWLAIQAVFASWNNARAQEYRKIHGIPDDWGTAANVVTMVFGNMGEDSGTGVAFTRDPATGEPRIYAEYLPNAQGEDVVAGIRTPYKIEEMQRRFPELYEELLRYARILEEHYRDMLDLEFTVEKGKLYFLQVRVGKRTGRAMIRIAVDLVKEGKITREEALRRVDPYKLEEVLHPMLDPAWIRENGHRELTRGIPASPGAAVGTVVLDPEEAARRAEAGEKVILVRAETSPDDIKGMARSEGILTARGGATSHAAVVSRGMGKPCVVGAEALQIDEENRTVTVVGEDGSRVLREGEVITIDGNTGRVYQGEARLIPPEMFGAFDTLLSWADEVRKLRVRANADTPEDAARARAFGAEGIGLARTEHMFFEGERIYAMQEMILADTEEERRAALARLLPYQKEDFKGLFRAMDGYPVTIRTLDPPLHEFLPKDPESQQALSRKLGVPVEKIRSRVEALLELNPMLGFRGCRLGILYPEITEMQARAIFEAACEVAREGVQVYPEVMVPLVSTEGELRNQRDRIEAVAREVFDAYGVEVPYKIGTMIEIPRAALTADEIAGTAEFFSFGTNDLTQTTFGFSRDDVGKFLPKYIEMGILPHDPFQRLDVQGVGQLIRWAVQRGRQTRPDLKVGICGEHGGDPDSVRFCHQVGLDYVSCSPYRVPVARLAAAQAALDGKDQG